MFKVLLVCAGLFTVSCGKLFPPKDDSTDPSSLDLLRQKHNLYKELSSSQQDQHGFILTNECDSTLFSGLLGVVKDVDLTAARDSSGAWRRRPIGTYPECYPDSSKSTISRDMLIGVMWWAWKNKRLDVAEDMFDYGVKNDWIMGEGENSRTYFVPGLQATLAEIIYRLGGKNHIVYRNIPQSYSKNTGFASHLDILYITLRGELTGSIEESALDIVKYNYERAPKNAMFSYAYGKYVSGNQNETIASLMDTSVFPADALPTKANYCEEWRWQRDQGSKDWEPCGSTSELHSGGDFMFVAKLVLGE